MKFICCDEKSLYNAVNAQWTTINVRSFGRDWKMRNRRARAAFSVYLVMIENAAISRIIRGIVSASVLFHAWESTTTYTRIVDSLLTKITLIHLFNRMKFLEVSSKLASAYIFSFEIYFLRKLDVVEIPRNRQNCILSIWRSFSKLGSACIIF